MTSVGGPKHIGGSATAAPTAGPPPAAPQAVPLVAASPPLLLLLPAAVVAPHPAAVAASPARTLQPDGPRHPLRDKGSLDLLVRGPGVLRKPVTAGPVTYSDRIPLDPRMGRLRGSLLLLGARRLDPLR